jgi:poly(beta-D-mannuronate) lyase
MQENRRKYLLKRSAIFSVTALLMFSYAAAITTGSFAPVAVYADDDDEKDPVVQITTPGEGSSLPAGTITVEGTAFDRGTVKVVKVRVDDGSYEVATPKADGDWSTWSTTVDITAGSHEIVAKVYDKAGHESWDRVPVNIVASNTTTADDLPPLPEQNATLPEALRTVEVSSISELMDAVEVTEPGDHIVLADGVYDTEEWLDENSEDKMLVSAKGTEDAPIVIASETKGGAEITGPAGFEFVDASHLIVQGFKFTHSQGDEGVAIECDNCQHVRFTQNHFELDESEGDNADWLGITSDDSSDNRIDYNTFVNKETLGNFILVRGSDDSMPQRTRIDHNYIAHHDKYIENGGECIRIGESDYGVKPAYTTVEYNHFESCNADAEVITVKSSNNIIRDNTFVNNKGSLVLRHGNDNLVDGNFFVNNEGGLRVYGHNHKIVNNYFGGNSGEDVRQTFMIGSATVESDEDTLDGGYSQPQNILAANNTLVNNKSSIVIGEDEDEKPLPPLGVKFVNNTIVGSSGALVTQTAGEDITWEGNVLYGDASAGDIPESGYVWKEPEL